MARSLLADLNSLEDTNLTKLALLKKADSESEQI